MLEIIDKLEEIEFKFNQLGLMPAVVQDYQTKDVLMVAYVNEESLNLSLEKGETVFYSRSRQELWHKGETSGNTQEIKEIYYDCDQDTILFLVEPAGPACHTGKTSCFYRKIAEETEAKAEEMMKMQQEAQNIETDFETKNVVDFLYDLILRRREEMPEDSYTTYLFEEGIDKILKKVGEESAEVIIASKNDPDQELVYETADLVYHMLVLLAARGIEPDQIREELKKRHK
ncbi:MAG: phosphoribosyl-ATP pyrophosphohydrolase / phosphoribosyl-AMP cyclohydrolase [Halanaerobium sp. 4-GBenrich]|uniref:Histidine biosynthesis bifunctional protein HisIE n=2 Tax=Halanaerobium congolense TaxID=54121 RepID=A0A4R7DWR9_9FIRM|nr:bifunctional phosphoribosyl-AMP cyclohydrolase/phosphoribosyl-ATP diphosphatase HisIE [Halanaerobium congolense]ODS50265.1 MAG: phosphoribosyl-ATP pyrophosphohydrolase / phosphoribosyl-AMP cyclohydrolase [Halanaerobium sp. 4-GBenrich]TDP09431.1 phosphoribosyl-ATP pyrophosphatase /phosphoribosyl-AMP cyclohydrolase [Halanaerobium congolense]TDS26779.1 phosphoribosyl-ATP pyrophosphatase /phosphoribosyl-AMP cyclohydrolase [Halanaerobium congolense]SDK42056.1 phosphoribosyl-ATP pyrophosphatase /p